MSKNINKNIAKIRWLTRIDEIECLQEKWLELESNVQNRTVFSCYDWVISWYHHYCGVLGEPLLGVATIDDRLVGIAPLVYRKATLGKVPVSIVEFVGFNAEAGEFLVCDQMEYLIGQFLASLVGSKDVDVISLHGFEEGVSELRVINDFARNQHLKLELIADRYAMVDLKNGYEAYYSSLRSKIRNNLKRYQRKISNTGEWKLEMVNGVSSEYKFQNGMKRVVNIYNNSWKAIKNGELGEVHRNFYEEVVTRFSKRGMIDICFLTINDKDVAFILWLVERDHYYDVKVSYDESFAAMSPGIFLMQEVLKKLSEMGVHTVISHGNREYKKNWVTRFVVRDRIFLFNNTIKGKLSRIMRFKVPVYLDKLRK